MILCPSMVCASYASPEKEIRTLEEAGADIFHYDIMGGSFVPNISVGLMDVKAVRALTRKMVNVYLMIDRPADKIDWFLDAGADSIYIHPESEPQTMKTLMYIRSGGKLSGLAVNPDTSLNTVRELFPHCDYLLTVSVFPGFARQTFIDSVDTEIRELIAYKKMYGYHIILDEACSPAVVQEYHALSVDGSVLGANALFHGEDSCVGNANLLRSLQYEGYHNGMYANDI